MTDSVDAKPKTQRTLAALVATGMTNPGDKPISWYWNKEYAPIFYNLHPEFFRKRFNNLIAEKYGESNGISVGTLSFHCTVCKVIPLSTSALSYISTRPFTKTSSESDGFPFNTR